MRGPVAMMGKSVGGKDGTDARNLPDGKTALGAMRAAPQAAMQAAAPSPEKSSVRSVLTVGAAREVTLQLSPSEDVNAVQLRVALPGKVKFSDGESAKIVWRGDAKRGVPIVTGVKIVASVTGNLSLRLTLEKPGADAPLQTQSFEIVVVP